ncbi:Hpt domain-containing protein [Sphingorhabdus sp.]|uniref:Hpt domain-containing protein n=1 Tax=Sphingorhabdus sp. TaxID=1902408 RepID=UPI00391ACF88
MSFRSKAAARAQTLRIDLSSGNVGGLRSLAHDLHGMAGTFGFDRLGAHAQLLEEATITHVHINDDIGQKATALADALDDLAKETH